MPNADEIADALASHSPSLIPHDDRPRAAVALLLREGGDGPEVLFIERARHEGDPWSGHMALPGGRVEASDVSVRHAAQRETREEVGIPLDAATVLGQLDDKAGNPLAQPRLVISAWVYRLDDAGDPVPNHEVAQAFWFPLSALLDRQRHVRHKIPRTQIEMPGIQVGVPGRHIVWGLTYSFLESFFVAVGSPLPDRWTPQHEEYARGMDGGTR